MGTYLLGATDATAVGVTVVATVVLLALVVAVALLLAAARRLRRQVDELAGEAERLLQLIDDTVRQAGHEVERVDRMVGSAEAISDAVGSASRLMGGALAAPLIKVMAFGSGLVRGVRALRAGAAPGATARSTPRRRRRHRSGRAAGPVAAPDGRREAAGRASRGTRRAS
jgi:Tfp pilus assembly protein PilW